MTEPTGYTAVGMVGFTDQGTYSASASYVKNDLVHYGGSIWCCLIDDTTGIEPRNDSANWEVFIDYSDLSNIKSDFLSLGYINQIPYPYYDGTSKTADGITWTVNNDKSITINGTATKVTYFYLLFHNANALTPNIPYAMSLGSDVDSSKLRMQTTYKARGESEKVVSSSSKAETEFTITDSNIVTIQFRLVVLSGQTIDNITVYPYIRKLTDGKSNRVLTEEVTQNSSDIQTLTNNVESNATNIQTLTDEVDANTTNIQTLTNKVTDLYNVNALNGKKILIIGDSISDPNIGVAGTTPVWSEYFQTMLSGVANVTIKARSGMQMVDCPNFLTSITNWDYDIVLVFLGTNDFASSVEMGDYLGNDNTRFCDALKATYIYIRDHIMAATDHKEDIYFITPIYGRPYQNTRKMPMWFYSASITGFCKKWGCKWINGLTFPMSGELYKNWTLVDDVHPTTAYAKIMSEYILGKLLSGGDVVSYNNDAMYADLSSLLVSGVTGTLKASFENEYLDIHFDIQYTPTQINQQITNVFPFDISDLLDNNLFAPCVTFSGTNGVVMGMLYRNTDNSINANVPFPNVNVSTKLRCHFRIQPKWANIQRSY